MVSVFPRTTCPIDSVRRPAAATASAARTGAVSGAMGAFYLDILATARSSLPLALEVATTPVDDAEVVLDASVEVDPDHLAVFAFYADVLYPASQLSVNGDLAFSSRFDNGKSGDTSIPGIVDEAGAFSVGFTPSGGGRELLFRLPMVALNLGELTIWADPADALP